MVYPHVTYLGPVHLDRRSRIASMTRELDSRTSDGIHVRLLWHRHDARVSVAVHDTKTGDAFELPVPDGSRALDVFHHPYAYAAGRRTRDTEPATGGLGMSFAAQEISRTHDKGS